MSTTAEDVSTTLSSNEPSVEGKADAIAELLVGADESEIQDEKDDENQIDASTESEDEESNEEQEQDGEEEETTLEAVADDEVTWEGMLGVTEADLSFDEEGNPVGFNTKVNGEAEVVSTKDLISGYQNNKSFTQKSQAHSEAVKEFNVQKEQVEQAYASKLESVDQLTKYFEKQLISEWDGINWEELRQTDPAEYAAARQDYASRASELQNIQQAIGADKESQNKETLEARNKQAQTYLSEQHELMLTNNPTWSDETVRETARSGLKTFVKDNYGFNEQEFDSVFDARLITLIQDAQKYHEGAKVAAKKIVNPVPKFQKSRGKGTKANVSKLEKLTAASRKAQGSEKRDLQQSAVAELLLGGT